MFDLENEAIGCNQMASQNFYDQRNINQKAKRKPAYYREYLRHKDSDLILICKDWNTVSLMRRLQGRICLMCESSPNLYDLSFCRNKDVWVLYSETEQLNTAIKLARVVQLNGAKKIAVILIDIKNLGD